MVSNIAIRSCSAVYINVATITKVNFCVVSLTSELREAGEGGDPGDDRPVPPCAPLRRLPPREGKRYEITCYSLLFVQIDKLNSTKKNSRLSLFYYCGLFLKYIQ